MADSGDSCLPDDRTGPAPDEFEHFVDLLLAGAPDGYEPWLFRCEKESKAPATEYGSWKEDDNRLTRTEAVEWMQEGGNIGIAGMERDGLVNVDIDDDDETDPADMKPTLRARSRSRYGRHAWYFAEDGEEIPNIPTDDKGEVRANGQYVLAPGSYVPTNPDDVPDGQENKAGYYTVEVEDEPASITVDELPDVFQRQLRKVGHDETEDTVEPDVPEGNGQSALFDVTARDVARREGASTKPSDRWESAFHGSTTGENMSLSNKGRIQCWRHGVAHGGLQALVALSDHQDSCDQVGTGHKGSNAGASSIKSDDSAIWHAWKYAKKNGYIPDDDPVPYRALKHICRVRDLCPVTEIPNEYDPENGQTIPDYAYNPALSSIEDHDGLDPGREKTSEFDDGADITAGNEATQSQDGGGEADVENDGGGDEQNGSKSLIDELNSQVIVPYSDPEGYDGDTIDQNVAVYRAAKIIDTHLNFVRPREVTRGWRDCLYMYVDGEYVGNTGDAGIYEPNAKAEIERMAEMHFMDIANDAFVRELRNKIERRNRVRAKKLEPDPERLVVNNGILDLTTGEVDSHTPSEYHRTKIDKEYDPDAECPRIDEFLHSIVDDADVDTLYRFIAHTLYKGYPEAKAAMLLGDGANGKSMFLSLVEEFLGEFNVSGRSLQDITEYRWAANDLVGKLANIHADMSDQDVDSMRMFKNLTGQDTVDADVKFEKPVKFTNHATMMFACNDMPVLRDDTQGNWRRWVLINFPNTFDSDDPTAEDAKPRTQMERELFTEDELQGLLARCVEEIKEWDGGRAWFPDTAGWRETRSKMRRAAEPVFDFAEACLLNDDGGHVEKSDVREAYRRYATKEGLPKLDREEFGRKLVMLSDYDVEPSQKRADDGPGRIMVYKGIGLNNRGKSLIGQAEGFDSQEAVLQTVRGEDGRVPEAMVIEKLASEYGIDNGRAQHAIDELKKDGRLMQTREHGVDWVEITK